MKKTYFLFMIALITMTGCTLYSVDSKDLSETYYPSKESSLDVIYVEEIDKPHEAIGIVMVNAERRQRMSEILVRMRREAAIIGADAITNIQSDATGDWKKLPAQQVIGNGYIRANFTASAVVFK